MNIITYDIKTVSKKEQFNLIGLGDIHLGSVGCDIKSLKETIEWIRVTPRTYWIGMGDFCECINITDDRFDPYSIDPDYNIRSLSNLITTQIDDVCALLRPIKHKGIAFVVGNHEEKLRLFANRDVGYEMSQKLGIPNLGWDGWVRLRFTRFKDVTVYTIYVNHGHKGGGRSGGKINALEDIAMFMDADLVMVGHSHKKVIAPPILKLGLDHAGKLTSRKQIAIMTGSFLKTYMENATTYGEKHCYAPCDIGVVKVMLKPYTKDIHASL